LSEAIANGFEPARLRIEEPRRLGGGMAAMMVAEVSGVLSFVLKLDREPKLVHEAKTLRRFRTDDSLPERFRARFPRVYAIKEDTVPYAYLMEHFSAADGFQGLDRLIFAPDQTAAGFGEKAVRRVGATMDALFEGYGGSRQSRLRPNIQEDYIARFDRLDLAARQDPLFQSRPTLVNGTEYAPWRTYLERIRGAKAHIDGLAPAFSCVVHGDPHPGNVQVRTDTSPEEIYLIDPKDWGTGDYLFDVAKMVHYLDCTGPMELLSGAAVLGRASVEGDLTLIDYRIDRPTWIAESIRTIRDRVAAFAEANGDPHWEERFALGMAVNLLGLPAGRLARGQRDSAAMLYGEGLHWLDRFVALLPAH
jgi:hypothetical protein